MTKQMLIALNDATTSEPPRDYLGFSGIGEPCYRKLQHSHYWTYKSPLTRRIKRLFKVGHDSESLMIADLNKIGFKFKSDQLKVDGPTGHWKGHIDGIIHKDGEEFLVEFKTHNDSSFKDLLKRGVKLSKPTHLAQVTCYMGPLNLGKCLYMALNKNTSEYYLEWIQYDENLHFDLIDKAVEVVAAETLLPRIGTNSPTWFQCRMCNAQDVCFNREAPQRNCRTCKFVDVLDKGRWQCSKFYEGTSIILSAGEQRIGCDSYKLASMFNDT